MANINQTVTDTTMATDSTGIDTGVLGFSLEESRRMLALEAAKGIPAANIFDYLQAAKYIEEYSSTGNIPPRDSGV